MSSGILGPPKCRCGHPTGHPKLLQPETPLPNSAIKRTRVTHSVFICLWNLDLSFASCTSCTSAMHDITQLRGMCIIGKEEEEEVSTP